MALPSRPRVRFGSGDVYQLRIELDGVLPIVWRRVAVSGRASLREVHGVIQAAMQRDDTGGYRFEVDGVSYLDPADGPAPGRDADETALEMLGVREGSRFVHIVEDHDEPWHHVITVEQITPRLVGERLPVCTAGRRASPPEDCRGPRDYRDMLAALQEPHDPRAADLRTWLPDNFDPGFVDLVAINATLGRIPKHRPAA
jgi:hypothetical protein